MTKLFTAIGLILIAGGLLYHFAALAVFNFLVPFDSGASRVATDMSYGENPRQRFDFYQPEGRGPFPVLLFVYGGSWDSGRKSDYAFVGHALAAKGFLTAIADYHLVPQFLYPSFVDDTAAAFAAVAKAAPNFQGDASRLFIMGHSAGGYNVAQAVLSGATDRAGIPRESIKAMATLSAPLDFLPLDSPKSIAAFSHFSDLPKTQPINMPLDQSPPMLLLHGAEDLTVKPRNSIAMQKALLAKNRVAELKIYPGVDHVNIMLALSKPLRNRAPSLDDVVNFFQRYD